MKMMPGKKIFKITGFLAIPGTVVLFLLYIHYYNGFGQKETQLIPPPSVKKLVKAWVVLSGNRQGKVVFARPPRMFILDLTTGKERVVPNVIVAGAPGRRQRGKTPRPSWAPDGKHFVYRYNTNIYVCDEAGNQHIIANKQMACGDETRWSWFCQDNTQWLAGPSEDKNVILVNISRPKVVKIAYGGGNVELHCEITGTGRYVVYDDGADIYVTPFGRIEKGIKISTGQSCRPCAAPDDRAAWLSSDHGRYHIYNAANGQFQGNLNAPPHEELYRLNWSNIPNFAVHMYGSRGNTKMYVRKVNTGEYVYIGCGWDPDLWINTSPIR
jgi:hypothetical protein